MADADVEALRSELDHQAALQRDADHRVKNTLQLISSLILLQSRRTQDEAVRCALKAVQQRVSAVSIAHRHVVRIDSAEQVEVAPLVRELVGDLAASAGRAGIQIALDLDPVTAPAAQGAPLALLVNEAVGNALNHAFPGGRNGHVQVAVRRRSGHFELSVADDGVGPPGGAVPTGFGMSIVRLLAQQLRGQLEIQPGQQGLRLAMTVPMDGKASLQGH